MVTLMISRLNPTGPVRLFCMIESSGTSPASSVPNAEPKIAPINMKAIRYVILLLSNVMARYGNCG